MIASPGSAGTAESQAWRTTSPPGATQRPAVSIRRSKNANVVVCHIGAFAIASGIGALQVTSSYCPVAAPTSPSTSARCAMPDSRAPSRA